MRGAQRHRGVNQNASSEEENSLSVDLNRANIILSALRELEKYKPSACMAPRSPYKRPSIERIADFKI